MYGVVIDSRISTWFHLVELEEGKLRKDSSLSGLYAY